MTILTRSWTKADGSTTTRWYVEFFHHGQRIRRACGPSCHSETKAKQFEAKLRADLERQGARVHTGKIPTLREAAEQFLEAAEAAHAAKNMAANTLRHYRNAWDAWLEPTELAAMRVDRITSGMINAVEFPGGPFTRKNARQALGHILNWCAEEKGYIVAAPRIKSTRVTGRKIRITAEIEQALRQHMKRDVADVFTMMLDDLMRNCEVFAMEWSRIDWERGEYHIARSKSAASQRTIPLSDRAIAMLKARQESSLRGPGQTGGIKRNRLGDPSGDVPSKCLLTQRPAQSPWVFPSRIHRCGHIQTIAEQFREARAAAGIPAEVKLYCSRHTGASELAERGTDPLSLRQFLGHENIATTNAYLHGDATKAREAINTNQRSRTGLKLEKRA